MTLLQIAQHADDLDGATDFYTVLLAFVRDTEGNTVGIVAFQKE